MINYQKDVKKETEDVYKFFSKNMHKDFENIINNFVVNIYTIKGNKAPITISNSKNLYNVFLYYVDVLTYEQMIYQLSHEMTHIVFYSKFGSKYNHCNYEEETLCVAVSLCVVKMLCSQNYFNKVIKSLKEQPYYYSDGYEVYIKCNKDIAIIKKKIDQFNINKLIPITYQ